MTRVHGEPGVLLHTRAYRETSLIVQFFTRNHGRVAAIARGLRRGKRGHELQPFYQGQVAWVGGAGLVTLRGFEASEMRRFTGNRLACAWYVAELIVRLTREREPASGLFHGLGKALTGLATADEPDEVATCLRRFEKRLLQELGYGPDFVHEARTGKPLDPEHWYKLVPESGFRQARAGDGIPGQALCAIGQDCYREAATRHHAKALFRSLLQPHLGPKPLVSRQLYRR